MIGSVKPLPFRPVFPTCGFMLAHGPPAVQLVAPVDDQVSVERPPDTTVVGEAVRVAVGGTVTVTVFDTQLEVAPVVDIARTLNVYVPEVAQTLFVVALGLALVSSPVAGANPSAVPFPSQSIS